MKISEKIVHLRKRNGLSQEDLAEKLEVSRQAISRWEMGTAKPDANNILQISRLFGVTTDYLLHDEYESDNDLPKIKESNHILHMNLTLLAIISQMAFLNATIKPFHEMRDQGMDMVELVIKVVPLLSSSIWMAFNLRYEKDKQQYRKNTRIELLYCVIQAGIALFGYYTRMYNVGTILLITVAMVYIFKINPKYMNRQLTKKKK
ncbi:MAG: helix-turn-helix transcriptional regulator [Lachnospiraceae bacterium]|nr:helix-turn-helix transcriptional regulator [Lachnospiraceae bacterium]